MNSKETEINLGMLEVMESMILLCFEQCCCLVSDGPRGEDSGYTWKAYQHQKELLRCAWSKRVTFYFSCAGSTFVVSLCSLFEQIVLSIWTPSSLNR